MGKGEISRYEQFLLFPQCFQTACFPGASKGVVVREWVNSVPYFDTSALKEKLRLSVWFLSLVAEHGNCRHINEKDTSLL